ncbi:hypothetical protein BDF14DRAFT_1796501 [Spinellus fusiger]|nr:hypothetical protein BDF14DRAFT_1796501 [Spinellus fusiger]
MALHTTNVTSPTSISTKGKTSLSDQNDIKKLKSNYGPTLAVLRELFSDWSEEDLLFAIRDADGDLELTIDRISEGHCTQWDEVKTKKTKKESKPKEIQPSITQLPREKQERTRQPSERGMSDRSRKGKQPTYSSTRPSTQPPTHTQASHRIKQEAFPIEQGAWLSGDQTTRTPNESTGTWASIASASRSTDTHEPQWKEDPLLDSHTTQTPQLSIPASNDTPKTWASLLKSKPKPVPLSEAPLYEPETHPKKWVVNDPLQVRKDDTAWNVPIEKKSSQWSDHSALEGVHDQQDEKQKKEWLSTTDPLSDSSERLSKPETKSYLASDEPLAQGPSSQGPSSVLTTNTISTTAIDALFGSLEIDSKKDASPVFDTTERRGLSQQTNLVGSTLITPSAQSSQPSHHNPETFSLPSSSHAFMKQEPIYSPSGMDNLSSVYSPYRTHPMSALPNVNPIVSPDYGLYGETQRATLNPSVNYYDPAYHESSLMHSTPYPLRDMYGQDIMSTTLNKYGQANTAPLNYPSNLPYYSHYAPESNAYPQSAYSHYSKPAYPMYANQPAPSQTSKQGSSPYAAHGYAYEVSQQHSYGHSMADTVNEPSYDDSTSFQHHSLASQKQSYGTESQLQDFLGHLSHSSTKADTTNVYKYDRPSPNNIMQSQSPHMSSIYQQQQQQQQRYGSNQPNYFGQQSSFSYQQQEPQQQQQQQQQHQSSSLNNRQQYWQ